ncbi:hypothetical protein V2H45_13730 [Tumidithrix elongata RA019]|uniref:Uncharacterized protein n=1 Tax=Tumidithrix elongata BACA0141 TaxID=2716417 RepID=A0AAW9PXL9_9CYAN|nr:hypothetical protein [Tumidithrix elongata RA019]
MVQYTLAQSPEVILTVSGRDSLKAREKAMAQLIELMDEGKLDTDLADGFSPQQFIEVKEPAMTVTSDQDDAVTQAVQLLNNLATLKIKVQELRTEAMKIRAQVDILFSDAPVSEEEINSLKEGFKVLKNFAQFNLRYLDARSQAEQARIVLDQALNGSLAEPAPTKVEPSNPEALPQAEVELPDAVDETPAQSTDTEVETVSEKATGKAKK